MTTITEYEDTFAEGNNIMDSLTFVKAETPEMNLDNFFDNAKKYISFALTVIDVLAKYFFKNGKLAAPTLLKFWIYFSLVVELYNLFKDFNAKKNN